MLNVLSGMNDANIKSVPVATGTTLANGDWVKLVDGKAAKLTAKVAFTDGLVMPVFAHPGDSYDNKVLAKADCVTSKACIIETDKVAAETIKAGDPLTVGAAGLTKAATGDIVVGYAFKDLTGGVLQAILG